MRNVHALRSNALPMLLLLSLTAVVIGTDYESNYWCCLYHCSINTVYHVGVSPIICRLSCRCFSYYLPFIMYAISCLVAKYLGTATSKNDITCYYKNANEKINV
uniref:Uncharacterized protein n=1 Tax=Glossina austeni TaxID=7395 RepID=A0A1A9VXB3_GLOAU